MMTFLSKTHRITKPNISYFENGTISRKQWFANNKLHRTNGPAIIDFYENGNIHFKVWCVDGERHREDGPAHIYYRENGYVIFEEWYINGQLYRTNGPAVIEYYENGDISYAQWFVNDKKIDISRYKHLFKPNTWEFKDKESEVIFKLSIMHQ